ncbi:similar to Saccharomyces cerevisiae YNL003C PET8 S-adenosylmethionine transporter of the mitochondrial inner membrane, member of the mitochondrial carrier family [Maudiozyma barnettii]|uniref:Putative mitochondrial carrier protein PET8 n=1 Tax=Maudiozyma barnettii TaxID=61262 RepID=A0A8H2VCJ4_9SACH|nr:Pet8p [Kazachstania barnettii]CAB4252781.1 similar to Saccharomyces cerevisiae YNL003C PET8 S-adenosylmethionine transporter of the mitochondrial inner membrane, member of the mitochondrial carrier family [Kazachstania barnettii]CAD1780571.1 similar to Saccharomyces cerevisiae YNL003C PET8 S-adenosylmethionine transporter of the mitochondrial inner membrane, member of the mitochondrial carrier family [Kazachstania barnettii]
MIGGSFVISLLSGAAAGTSTDLVFFPIDTIKTRLQAKGGFFKNGGYHNIYRGVGSAIVASAPGASLFFVTYDTMKIHSKPYINRIVGKNSSEQLVDTLTHMFASTLGEISACLVRVPAEVIKQRTQTSTSHSSYQTLKIILQNSNGEGIRKNLYRGWSTTIMREIPFTCIQFPLYEYMKKRWKTAEGSEILLPWKGAICGSIAGGIAAAVTTPLDFLKTRIMLHTTSERTGAMVRTILKEEGPLVFFSGIGPRTMWISAGGAIFLGVYESVHYMLSSKEEGNMKLQ